MNVKGVEEVVTNFKVMCQHLPEVTEIKHEYFNQFSDDNVILY
jgi:hypothetical protein